MKCDELENLIQNLIDGAISQEDFDILNAELCSNTVSMSLYLSYVDLDNMMVLDLEGERHNFMPVVPIERIVHRQERRTVRIAIMAAAAVVLLSLVGMRLYFIDTSRPPTLAFETSPGTQFILTHEGAGDGPVGMVLEEGSRLQISHGVVELTFRSGVKSIVTAPADFTLHDDDTLFLNHGKAWFRVSQEAIGFQVRTPDAQVVDLGTEFGVISSDDSLDEVHVFKGKVEVLNLNSLKHKELLTDNQARIIGPAGRLKPTPIRTSDFRTTLPKQPLPRVVFENQFNSGKSGWLIQGNIALASGDYAGGTCKINTKGNNDHSALHFDCEGKEIQAIGVNFVALGYGTKPPPNSIITPIPVTVGNTYTIYFRYAGSHNATQKITASMSFGSDSATSGPLNAPDKAWTSASFTFTPSTSGEAILKFEDAGSTEDHGSDPLIDSVLVTSIPNSPK